jgi:hypothetical protein
MNSKSFVWKLEVTLNHHEHLFRMRQKLANSGHNCDELQRLSYSSRSLLTCRRKQQSLCRYSWRNLGIPLKVSGELLKLRRIVNTGVRLLCPVNCDWLVCSPLFTLPFCFFCTIKRRRVPPPPQTCLFHDVHTISSAFSLLASYGRHVTRFVPGRNSWSLPS